MRYILDSLISHVRVGAVLLLSMSCTSLPRVQEDEALDVTIFQIITNPSSYDGKRVRVKGYATLGFEVDSLNILPAFAQYHMSEYALYLDLDPMQEKERATYHEKIVIVEGVVDASCKGMGLQQAGLREITRFEIWKNLDGSRPTPKPRSSEEKLKDPDPWGDY